MLSTCDTQFDPEATRTRWPQWEEPILHWLISMDFQDDEIDDVLEYLQSTGRAETCPHLSVSHVPLVAELIPAWVRTAAIESRGGGR